MPMPTPSPAATCTTLPNGLRAVAIPMPWRETASLSVFVRSGSLHEPRRLSGLSHVVEHMAFKGTASRGCQQINLDAERLGAEVNAHTDKDHTAFHMEGLACHLDELAAQLADIVRHGTFPADELERERQVILHEYTDLAEDPAALAFQLFDRACYGVQPAGQPVIGTRASLARITREDLDAHVGQRFTASNVVVAAAGPIDAGAWLRGVARSFGDMPAGEPNGLPVSAWEGGLKLRRLSGSSQCQIVVGFECAALADPSHAVALLAAALLGDGMSSPLLDEMRERRGLAYDLNCNADVLPHAGQFVIEAATAPDRAEEFLDGLRRLLQAQADRTDPVDHERALNQMKVRALRQLEHPSRRLEAAAQELFTFGQLRDPLEGLARLQAVTPRQLRDEFARMLSSRAAVALAGSVPARVRERAEALFVARTGRARD